MVDGPMKITGLRQIVRGTFLKSSVYRTKNGHPALFRAGEGEGEDEGVEEEQWHLTSVTPLPVDVGSLTATSQMGLVTLICV